MSTTSLAVSHGVMKRNNLSLVLGIVAQFGTASRSDIIARSNLTQPAITRIVAELISAGLLEESMPVSVRTGRGRPATVLTLKRGHFASIGVDVRYDRITVISRCLSGDILTEDAIAITSIPDVDGLTTVLVDLINSTIEKVDSQICGIGISLPVEFDDERETIIQSSRWPWRDVRIAEIMREKLGKRDFPLVFDTTAGTAALANSRKLSERDGTLLAHLQISTSVAIGMTANGERLHRLGSAASRFNHLPVMGAAPAACAECGAASCVESQTSFGSLVARSASLGITPGDDAQAMQRYCAELVEISQGDDDRAGAAREAIEDIAKSVAYISVMVICTTGATAFSLGGVPEFLGEAFEGVFEAEVRQLMPTAATALRHIIYTHNGVNVGDRASTLGSALMGLEELRANPIFLNG